jgi:hypothetical protein
MAHVSLAKIVTTFTAAMMLTQGLALIYCPPAAGPATLSELNSWFGGSAVSTGVFLIITSCFTFIAAVSRSLAPFVLIQVSVSMIYAAGSISAVVRGTYADAYVPAGGAFFIYNDQIGTITLLLIHTIAATVQFTE